MFGYVAPIKETMDKQDFALFRAYYCGVCTNMSRLSRFALSYDCAFLAVALDSCAKSTNEAKVRCPANPLKKVKVMQGDYVKYAADINTILAYHNICDNIHDGGGIKYKIARLLIKSAYKKAVQRRPEAGQLINTRLTSLGQLEKKSCANSDMAAHEFAELLRCVAAPGADKNGPLGRLFYNIGRWIYLVDAVADYQKDIKKGNYNVLALEWGDYQSAIQAMDFALFHTLSEAEKAAAELAPRAELLPIINSVLLTTLPYMTLAALKKEVKDNKPL